MPATPAGGTVGGSRRSTRPGTTGLVREAGSGRLWSTGLIGGGWDKSASVLSAALLVLELAEVPPPGAPEPGPAI